jgi:hypothetical protein
MRYRLGQGKLFDGVIKLVTGENEDPEGLRLLNKVLSSPEAAPKLFNLMLKDMIMEPGYKPNKPRRKRMRRGVGSY